MLVGGAVGTGLRLGIDLVLPHADAAIPVSTIIANTVGAFALAVLVARVWPVAPNWLRAGLGAGLLGSFTTFSAIAVTLVALSAQGQWLIGAAVLLASLLLGFGAALLGLRLGGALHAPIDTVDE